MRIGIDISLTIGEKAGIGNYCHNLVRSLGTIDHKNKYLLFPFYYYIFHPDFKKTERPSHKNFRVNLHWLSKKIIEYLWQAKSVPRRWFFPAVDVLHSTTFCVPKTGYKKLVVTIYDISFLTHPAYHLDETVAHCHKGTLEAVAHADKIIVISEHTKKDLIHYYHCDPQKIAVTLLGVDERFKRVDDAARIAAAKKKYGITTKFIFNIGSIEPRKNITGLVEAYAQLPGHLQDEYGLIIGGGKGWKNSALYETVARLKLEDRVRFIGFVDDEDLPYLYNGATIFVYPTFYEGFGLPVLEAMACGCPVISSNVSSIPEVVGAGGLLVNPEITNEIAAAMGSLLSDTKVRAELSAQGLLQAARFSWLKCAQETLKVYEELILR
jgi:glycosyltransferase involved in cell wall biosynthesis